LCGAPHHVKKRKMVAIISGNGFGLATGSSATLGQSGIFGNPNLGNSGEAAFINVANGNLVLRDQDEFVAALGADLSLTRTYNAQGSYSDGSGANWRMGEVKQIGGLTGTLNTAGSTVTRTGGDGSQALYVYDVAQARYVSTDGAGGYNKLSLNASQEWVWTSDRRDLGGVSEVYSGIGSGGRIKSTNDQTGVRLAYQYNAAGQLSQVTDASGDVTSFDYVGSNLGQVRVTTAAGATTTRTRYAYDGQNRLTGVVTDLTPDDNSVADGNTYSTAYTYVGNTSQVASIVQGDGTALSFTYTLVDGVSKIDTVTDGLGQKTTFSYAAGQTTVTDPLHYATVYAYDAAGQLLSVTAPAVNGVSQVTAFNYDAKGNVLTVTDPRGKVTTYVYDANGNRIKETNAAGDVVTRVYDLASNNLLSETQSPDGTSALTTNYVYDAGNRPRFIVSPEGRVQEYVYNADGLRASAIDYTGAIYTSAGTPTEAGLASWAASVAVRATTINRTDYSYDVRGQVIKSSSHSDSSTQIPLTYVQIPLPAGVTRNGSAFSFTSSYQTSSSNAAIDSTSFALGASLQFEVTTPATLTRNMLSAGFTSDSAAMRVNFDGTGINTVMRTGSTTTYPGWNAAKPNTTYVIEMSTSTNGAASMLVYEKGRDRSTGWTQTQQFQPGEALRFAALANSGPTSAAQTPGSSTTIVLDKLVAYTAPGAPDFVVIPLTPTPAPTMTGVTRNGSALTLTSTNQATSVWPGTAGPSIALGATVQFEVTTPAVLTPGMVNVGLDSGTWMTEGGGRVRVGFGAGNISIGFQNGLNSTSRNFGTDKPNTTYVVEMATGTDGATTVYVYEKGQSRATAFTATYQFQPGVAVRFAAETYCGPTAVTGTAGSSNSIVVDKITMRSTALDNGTAPATSGTVLTRSYVYDQHGRLMQSIDGNNKTSASFTYDGLGRQLTATDALGNVSLTTYNNMFSFVQLNQANGLIIRNFYGPDSKLTISQQVSATGLYSRTQNSYDADGRLRMTETMDGHATYYLYDAAGRQSATIDANHNLTAYYYNADNQVTRTVQYAGTVDVAQLKVANGNWRELSVADLNADATGSRSTWNEYDAAGRLAATVDATGSVIRYQYDHAGRLTAVIRRAKVIDPATLATVYAAASIADTASPDDLINRNYYDKDGKLRAEVDAQGILTEHRYDALGQRIETIVHQTALTPAYLGTNPALDQLIATSGGVASHERYFYGVNGQLAGTLDNGNYLTELKYDLNGNVSSRRHYAVAVSAPGAARMADLGYATGDADLLTSYTYTVRNQLATETAPGGIVTRYSYDNMGQLIETRVGLGSGTESAQARQYDLKGNVTAELSAEGAALLTGSQQPAAEVAGIWQRYGTSYTYNSNNLRLSATDPNGNKTRYYYDALGNLIRTVNALGEVTALAYNAFGQVLSQTTYGTRIDAATLATLSGAQNNADAQQVIDSFKSSALDTTQSYEYDGDGHLTATVDALKNRSTIHYDVFGRADATEQQNVPGTNTPAPATDPGARSFYDADGRLAASLTSGGSLTAYTYNALGQLTDHITYSKPVAFDITAASMKTLLTDPSAQRDTAHDLHQRYFYDARGLVTATMTAEEVSGGQVLWSVVRNTYDGNGNLLTRTAYANKVPTADSLPAAASYPADNAADSVVAYAYDSANRLLATATAQNAVNPSVPGVRNWSVVRNSYDLIGRLAMVTAYATARTGATPTAAELGSYKTASATDAVTSYTYDTANRIKTVATAQGAAVVNGVTTVQWAVTERTYDAMGQLRATTQYATAATSASLAISPAGIPAKDASRDRVTSFAYDATGRLTDTADAEGGKTLLFYDAKGNIIQRMALGASPVDDRITRYYYDLDNRLQFSIDAAGDVTEQRYDTQGNLAAVVRYAKPVATWQLTDLTSSLTTQLATSADDRTEHYIYDRNHRLVYAIDALGYLTETTYDAFGRVAATSTYPTPAHPTDYTLAAVNTAKAAAGTPRVTSFDYDAEGNLVRSTDAMGFSESYGYDALCRKTSFTNKLQQTWTYAYDSVGHMVLETAPAVDAYPNGATNWASQPPKSVALKTAMAYDTLGNLVTRTEGYGSDQPRVTSYGYDLVGRQVWTKLPALAIYDVNAAVSSVGAAPRTEVSPGQPTITVTYDVLGNAVSNQDVGGAVSYKVYDRLGQVRYDVDANGYVTGYEHDSFGAVTRLTRYATALPDYASFAADAANRTAAVVGTRLAARASVDSANDRTITTRYDQLGHAVKVTEPLAAVYDEHALNGVRNFQSARTTETHYDAFGEARQVLVYGADSAGVRLTAAASTRYYYDANGNKTAQIATLQDDAAGRSGYLTTFDYDATGSLLTQTEYSTLYGDWQADWKDTRYGIPARDSATDRVSAYAYDANGRKTSEAHNGAATSYGYDVLGNITRTTDALGGASYSYYDVLGRVSAVAATGANAAGSLTEFRRDLYGNVVVRIDYANGAPAGTTAAAKPVAVADPAKDRVTLTSYDNAGHATQVIDAEGKYSFTSYDIYGRVAKQWRTVTNATDPVNSVETSYVITAYDKLGRQLSVTRPGAIDLVRSILTPAPTVQSYGYNAFGEATQVSTTAMATDGVARTVQTQYTRYDNAGHAWISNAGDGIDKVSLFDAQGNVTVQIRSGSTDPAKVHELANLSDARAALSQAGMQRTDMRYDLLGHLVDNSGPRDTSLSVLRFLNGEWVSSVQATNQAIGDAMVLIGRPEDLGKSVTLSYRLIGGSWSEASDARVQWLGGRPVFNTVGLPDGNYEYKVYLQPNGEPRYESTAATFTIADVASTAKNNALVRLYLLVLNRAPDAPTLNGLVTRLNAGATLVQIAQELLNSTEVQGLLRDGSAAFLTNVFKNALHVDQPASAEIAGWVAQFDLKTSGTPDNRAQTLLDLLTAKGGILDRRVNAVVNYLSQGGSDAATEAVLVAHADSAADGAIAEGSAAAILERQQAQLARLYLTVLGRAPNKSGFDWWMDAIKNNIASMEDVAEGLLDSQEGMDVQLFPKTGLSTADYNKQLVTRAYLNLLGRAPGDAERDSWLARLNDGSLGRGAFILALDQQVAGYAGSDPVLMADRQALFDKVVISVSYAGLPSDGSDVATQVAAAKAIIAATVGAADPKAAAAKALATLQAQAQVARDTLAAAQLAAASTPLEDLRAGLVRLYVALLGRAPLQAGLQAWMSALTSNPPNTLANIAKDMMDGEAQNAALYPDSVQGADFVKRVYNIAFNINLPANSPELATWVPKLTDNSHATRASVAMAIVNAFLAGSDAAGQAARATFNNKMAVGLTYAMNMGGANQADAAAILAMVTATDTSAAIAYGIAATSTMLSAAALAAQTAANSALALTASAVAAQQQTTSAANALNTAGNAQSLNPMAGALLRAAQLYAGILNRGHAGSAGFDAVGLSNLARSLLAGWSDATAVQDMLNSDEGKKPFPPDNYSPAAFVTQLYMQVLNQPPSTDDLNRWIAVAGTVGQRASAAVQILNSLLQDPIASSNPQRLNYLQGRAAFEQNLSASLVTMTSAFSIAATNANDALTAASDAKTKADAASIAAGAVTTAVAAAAGTSEKNVMDVVRTFIGILNRGSGTPILMTGLNFWSSAMTADPTYDRVRLANEFITNTDEGKALYASTANNDSAFVNKVFTQVYGRLPTGSDPDWTGILRNNHNANRLGAVASAIIDSLLNNTAPTPEAYQSKSDFDQRVSAAIAQLTSEAPTFANSAAEVLRLANEAEKTSFSIFKPAQTAFLSVTDWNVDHNPAVITALSNQGIGQNYLASSAANVRTITQLMAAFNMPTDVASINAKLAGGSTDTALKTIIGIWSGVSSMPNLADSNAKLAFINLLFLTVLGRGGKQEGIDSWMKDKSSDAITLAYSFYKSAMTNIQNGIETGPRANFMAQVSDIVTADTAAANAMVSNYITIWNSVNGELNRIRQAYIDASTDYSDKQKATTSANDNKTKADKTVSGLAEAAKVQAKALLADSAGRDWQQANLTAATAAQRAGLAIGASVADCTTALTTANSLVTALPLDITLTSALAAAANAAAGNVVQENKVASADAKTRQVTQITQMYIMLLNREPTLAEVSQRLDDFKTLSFEQQADLLIAVTPALTSLSNNDYVTRLFNNGLNRQPVTNDGLAFWSGTLTGPQARTRGQLLSDLLISITRDNINSDTATLAGKVSPALTHLAALAKSAVDNPKATEFIDTNTAAARSAAQQADAASAAALTPGARAVVELTQLYLVLLNRVPDAGALNTAIYLHSGNGPQAPVTQGIVESILASNEIKLRFPSELSDQDFVSKLLAQGLGDVADLSTLTAQLTGSNRISRAQLVLKLIGDTYAYSGSDPVKLSGSAAFKSRVSNGLSALASSATVSSAGLDKAQRAVQDILAAPVLTQRADGFTSGIDYNMTGGAARLVSANQITVDRWGNVLSVTDARDPNWKIAYTYNYNNQQLSQTVNTLTPLTAVKSTITYDALGRQTSTTDFNGNTNKLDYDGNGNVITETHADGGLVTSTYNLFGDRLSVKRWDGAGSGVQMNYAYDHLGRLLNTRTEGAVAVYVGENTGSAMLVHTSSPTQLTEQFEYDELGRKIRSTDAAGVSSYSRYDLDGNVVSTMMQGGLYRMLTAYDAFHHRTATLDALGKKMTWTVDGFGRIIQSVDMGGAVTDYRYDGAGRLTQTSIQRDGVGSTISQTYEGGLLVRIVNSESGLTTDYTYDAVGNRLSEKQSYAANGPGAPARVQNNTLVYDKQNRLTSVHDDLYQLDYTYDDNGNRTSVTTTYAGAPKFTKYNAYDAMNRQTVVNADSWDAAQKVAVLGATGHQIAYDQAGNRVSDSYIGVAILTGGGGYATAANTRTTETYSYDAVGRLQYSYRDGVLADTRNYDADGRITMSGLLFKPSDDSRRATFAAGIASQKRTYSYDTGGHMTRQQELNYDMPDQDIYFVQDPWNMQGGYDAMGNLTGYTVVREGTSRGDNGVYKIDYLWTDGAREQKVTLATNNSTTTSVYDNAGNRIKVYGENGQLKKQFWYDADGHVQSKVDDGQAGFSLIVNGQVLGDENSKADNILGSAYQPVNASALTAAPSSYSVQRDTETLQGIAQAIWGDSKLWYLIADANGLGSDTPLKVGDILRIPSRVNTVHNDYATFKPYDASEAIGNTAPSLPPPSHGGGCGGVGTIIMIAVAVAVTIYTAGALSGATANLFSAGLGVLSGAGGFSAATVAYAAAGGAAGSIASQVVGNAIGAQDGFSWKGVALSAVAAGASAGIGGLAADGAFGTTLAGTTSLPSAAGRAALSNVAAQGVGMVTGLQNGFSWRNVAAAATGALAGAAAGAAFGQALGSNSTLAAIFGQTNDLAVRTVSGFAAGATASILRGGKIAVAQIVTDAFGNALGSSLAEQVNDSRTAARINADQMRSGAEDAAADRWAFGINQPTESARVTMEGSFTSMSAAMVNVSGSSAEALRAAEMARIIRQANEPQYQDAAPMHIEINGVGSSDPSEYNSGLVAAASARGENLSPTIANVNRLGLVNDPSLMSYGDEMRNVGHFLGDLASGAAKGLDNLVPETAAFAYRMTGYAAAGVVSLFDTDTSDKMFSQYEKVTGRIFNYDNDVQAFGGTVAQIAAPSIFKGAVAAGGSLYDTEQSIKQTVNYDYRHWFSGTQTLGADTTFYAYKNSSYLAADYQPMQLWLTPELMSADQAVQKLALPYAKGYDTLLTVKLPQGTTIMNPRPVWSLFGRPGGGVETRVYSPVTSNMYNVGPIPPGIH
jgi:YD repeat-containing protein